MIDASSVRSWFSPREYSATDLGKAVDTLDSDWKFVASEAKPPTNEGVMRIYDRLRGMPDRVGPTGTQSATWQLQDAVEHLRSSGRSDLADRFGSFVTRQVDLAGRATNPGATLGSYNEGYPMYRFGEFDWRGFSKAELSKKFRGIPKQAQANVTELRSFVTKNADAIDAAAPVNKASRNLRIGGAAALTAGVVGAGLVAVDAAA